MQTDPIFYKDDMNLYAYVAGDPINLIDVSGHQAVMTAFSRPVPVPLSRFPTIRHAYEQALENQPVAKSPASKIEYPIRGKGETAAQFSRRVEASRGGPFRPTSPVDPTSPIGAPGMPVPQTGGPLAFWRMMIEVGGDWGQWLSRLSIIGPIASVEIEVIDEQAITDAADEMKFQFEQAQMQDEIMGTDMAGCLVDAARCPPEA